MSEREVQIRVAAPEDAKALLEIYAPYVERTVITFEYEVPDLEEFRGRIRQVLEKYPYLVAEADGEIVGYAYANTFKGRAAYDWAVETSIYLRMDQKRKGIGAGLYRALERALSLQNILNLNACIAYTQTEDEYLTNDSVYFHDHMGYRMVGEFRQCGYKFGRWYDMVWMEKHIGPHLAIQPPIKPFPGIQKLFEQSLLSADEIEAVGGMSVHGSKGQRTEGEPGKIG